MIHVSKYEQAHPHPQRTYVPHGVYFVTTTVQERMPYFAITDIAKIVEANMWNTFRIQECIVFAYVIMPDHLHLLVQPRRKNISECMRSIKTNTSRDVNRYVFPNTLYSRGPGTSAMDGLRGFAINGMNSRFQWQQSFYDHVIMDDKDFRNHVEYIRYNPVKAGLCKEPGMHQFLYVNNEAIQSLLV